MFALLALSLAPIGMPEAGWIAFDQPAVAGTTRLGCDDDRATSLASNSDRWNVNGDEPEETFTRFTVYLEFERGELRDVRSYTPDCKVRDADRAQRRVMDAGAGVELLRGLLESAHGDTLESNLVAALAHIDHASVTPVLANVASDLADEDRGQDALFWLALRRGDAGRQIVTAHLEDRWPLEHRHQAVMSLALSANPQALETVRDVARRGEPGDMRAHAVAALGIVGAPGALADLHSIFLVDEDAEVREQAIFALAQLDHPEAARVLANIVRDPRNGEHRRTALFWLAHMPADSSQQEIDALVSELF